MALAKDYEVEIVFLNKTNVPCADIPASIDLIEGVAGKGDTFMVGERDQKTLPADVTDTVKRLNNQIRTYHNELDDVSIVWVYDGTTFR